MRTGLWVIIISLITLSLLISPTGIRASSPDRYVDANADQSGDGLSWATAWQTISEAATAALPPGTVVHIRPGIYRETIRPQKSGTITAPIIFKAEAGPDTVYVVGSETAETLGESWQPLSAYTGTLTLQPGVDSGAIRFLAANWSWEQEWDAGHGTHFPIETDLIALVDETGQATRLPLAREPDWTVDTADKHHENWWTADGGAANLNPTTPTDSNTYLMDTTDDATRDQDGDGQPDFPNIPAGNLGSIFTGNNDFTDPRGGGDPIRQNPLAASLIFNDGRTGHYTYRYLIDAYNAATGVVHVLNPLPDEGPDGEGHQFTDRTKFYVEGTPRALDCPGEWVHHDGRIFILTGKAATAGCGISLSEANLNSLEIARRFMLIRVEDVSHLRFEDLNLAFNNYAKYGYYYGPGETYPAYLNYPLGAIQINAENTAVQNIQFDGISLEHAVTGLYMGYPSAPSSITVRNSTFRQIDGTAMQLQAPDGGGLEGIVVENNRFEGLGFRPQIGEGTGLSFSRIGDFLFRGNTVVDVGHNGVQFHQGWDSYISSNILVEHNTFDGACRMAYDCAGLKFHGGGKGYEDVLVKHNISRNQRAWSYAAWLMELPYRQSEPDGWWPHTPLGELGMGMYLDYASGVTFYRNLLLDNSAAGLYYTGNYREHRPNLVIHNTIFGALDGVHFGNSYNDMPHTDSRILGNIFAKVENAGLHLAYSQGDTYNDTSRLLSAQNVELDRNLYRLYAAPPVTDPWSGYDPAWFDPADLEYLTAGNHWVTYPDVADLQAKTPWENHGLDWQTGQSLFVAAGGAVPAGYYLASDSLAVDAGLETLPTKLSQLMTGLANELGVTISDDPRLGDRYDAGAFEYRSLSDFLYLPLINKEAD